MAKISNTFSRSSRNALCHDAELGFWGTPNLDQMISFPITGNTTIRVRHDEFGNRTVRRSSDSGMREGIPSIVCLGGSHTWGAGIEIGDRYSEHLEILSGAPVYNLGHVSLSLGQILLALQGRVHHYKPDIVLIEQYPQSIVRIQADFVAGFVRPSFFLNDSGELGLRPVPRYTRNSILRKVVGDYVSYKKELKEYYYNIDLTHGYNEMYDPLFMKWKSNYYTEMYDLAGAIVLEIKRFCEENSIKLLFVLGADRQIYAGSGVPPLLDYYYPRDNFMAILDKHGISSVDTSIDLIATHGQNSPVIFSDGHINALGNKVIGETVFRKLKVLEWL